jgi:hypothetical protein
LSFEDKIFKIIVRFYQFVKVDVDIMGDVIEESKLLNCLVSLLMRMSIDESKGHTIVLSYRDHNLDLRWLAYDLLLHQMNLKSMAGLLAVSFCIEI